MSKSTKKHTRSSILRIVCEEFGVQSKHIKGKSRPEKIAHPRMAYLVLAYQYTPEPMVSVSKFVNKDHGCVINAQEKVPALADTYRPFIGPFLRCLHRIDPDRDWDQDHPIRR